MKVKSAILFKTILIALNKSADFNSPFYSCVLGCQAFVQE